MLPHQIYEQLMNATIFGKFGMEGRRHPRALANQDREAIPFGQHLNPFAHSADPRCTDVHHLQRSTRKFCLLQANSAIDLAAIGIAFDADIQDAETLLHRVGDLFCQKDATCAGSEGWFLSDKLPQRIQESVALQKLEKSGRFSTGEYQTI